MNIVDKLNQIKDILNEIGETEPGAAAILYEAFGIGLNTIAVVAQKGNRKEVDLDEQIEMVSAALGISMVDLVMHIVKNNVQQENTKEPDEETMNFITTDLDDYEKFIAQANAKQNIDFLKEVI